MQISIGAWVLGLVVFLPVNAQVRQPAVQPVVPRVPYVRYVVRQKGTDLGNFARGFGHTRVMPYGNFQMASPCQIVPDSSEG
jgi:hypothetical protein